MYEMGQEEIDAVAKVIQSGQLFRYRGGEGGEVSRFEQRLCEMMGVKYALSVSSGTGALICGLVGMGVGPGDEVIIPAYTWLASAGAILSAGAIPVLCDVDKSLMLDPDALERMITPQTKAVMPVHMGGRPCDMDRICSVAAAHGVRVIEDACQAVGGSYHGRRLTSFGDCGAFSFNQFKNITCGEGGALLTNDRKIYERALIYHDMGCTFRGHSGTMTEPAFLGNTFRSNEIAGAILNVQLDRLDSILERLRQRRDWVLEVVNARDVPFALAPTADRAGECGCSASFFFESAQQRHSVGERFNALDPNCSLGSPIDSGLHLYTNWTVLLDQCGGHHPLMNPFLHPANQTCRLSITKDDCPATLEYLARTGMVAFALTATQDACIKQAEWLCQAAGDVAAGK
ncbi:MAG: DegT/DnrJ/EryC1/StrS family aminotransferase [Lentisphaerae bacterium]|nr:DegT/DnrJ/EryC1/StrS family aminotransferase [Lentisphaerota bacterium]